MTVYALRHPDGRYLYHLPKPDTFKTPGNRLGTIDVTGVYADGQPMEELNGDWWASSHEATQLTTTGKPSPKTTSYQLSDPTAESVRYPAALTVDQWKERRDTDENLWQLYTGIREDQPTIEHVYDGPIMVLEGRDPPGPGGRTWIAALPHALTERPEYKHLCPGRIPGLRAHLGEVIKTMPRVRHCFDNYQGYQGLHVVLSIQFDKPQTRWQADLSRRTSKPLKTGRNVPVLVDRRLELPVPMDVFADTYEQALAAWEEQVTFWTGLVESATVAACSACGGTGHVQHGAEKYTR